METISTFEWNSMCAETVLALSALAGLTLSALLPGRASKFAAWAVMAGLVAALVSAIFQLSSGAASGVFFGGMLGSSSSFGVFASACALLSGLMCFSSVSKVSSKRAEFLSVLSICTAGLILFVRSNNLMFSFVALECATVCLYVMAAWNKDSPACAEAGVKYLVASGVSGALFLLGTAFVYGAGLKLEISALRFEDFSAALGNPIFLAGMSLVCAGVLFKVAAFPFQFWSPDVYQGAPTPAAAFFAVASKAAGMLFLFKICSSIDFSLYPHAGSRAELAVSVVAAATIIMGNLGGITQINAKRLLAFSGIANAGYLLVLIAAVLKFPSGDLHGLAEVSLYFYLAAYMFANYSLFYVVGQDTCRDDYLQSLSDYRGIFRKNAIEESALTINLASLAGVPPTAGFFGKLLILIVAWYAQLYWLMAVMVFGSAVSVYYYFAWLRATYSEAEGGERKFAPFGALAPTSVALSAATMLFGLVLFFMI